MKLKDLIIVGLFLVIIYLFTCNKPNTVVKEKTVRFTDTIVEVDTIVNEIVKNHYNISEIHDTIVFKDVPLGLDTFYYPIKDSLLEATITAYSIERPYINFDYKLKQFEIKERTLIKDSVYTEKIKSYLSVGAMLVGSKNSFGFAPQIQYNHNSGNNLGVGYDVINRNINISYTKKLSFN